MIHCLFVTRSLEEIVQILAIRAETESISVDADALALMGEVGANTSLRYVVQMLTPAKIIADTCGRDAITRGDVEEVNDLFLDAKASSRLLARSEGYLM